MSDTESRRSNTLDDSRAALRMLMVELEALAPQQAHASLGFAPRSNDATQWTDSGTPPGSPHGTGRAA